MAPSVRARLKRAFSSRAKADGDYRPTTANSPDTSSASTRPEALPLTPTTPSVAEPLSLESPAVARSPAQSEITASSLWDRAYDRLRAEDAQLAAEYEQLLSDELLETAESGATVQAAGDAHHSCRIDHENPGNRKEQLKMIVDRALLRIDENRTDYTLFGRRFVLPIQHAHPPTGIEDIKSLLSYAVSASPEASWAWAGVCAALPILAYHGAAEQANRDGFAYVATRMRLHAELENQLRPAILTSSPEQRWELEGLLIDLYRRILNFQLRSVLRLYRTWLVGREGDDSPHEDWKRMLSTIKDLEAALYDVLKTGRGLVSGEELERLIRDADQSAEILSSFLSVSEPPPPDPPEEEQEPLEETALPTQIVSEPLVEVHDADPAPVDLPTVDDARYDSAEVQDIPKCYEATAASVRERIVEWTKQGAGEPIFWLSGPVGTGKTTVARALVDSLAAEGWLAASYFFDRGRGGFRNGTARFFSTIASQLRDTIPRFDGHLRKSLGGLGRGALEKRALEDQFKKVILDPLTHLSEEPGGMARAMVIVIDALDECARHEHVTRILHLLSQIQTLRTIVLRVLITSRDVDHIADAFQNLRTGGIVYRHSDLHRDFHDETKADVSAYLRGTLAVIKTKRHILASWPDPEDIDRLVDLASDPSPLFVYASALCRFIDGVLPKKRLQLWFRQCDNNVSQLGSVYLPIFQDFFNGVEDEMRKDALRVLGSVVLVARPLSARTLAALLSMDEDEVYDLLWRFRLVLAVTADRDAPVRPLHKSFGDFVCGKAPSDLDSPQVGAAETHGMLASKCIDRMKSKENGLRKDMCNLGDYGKPREEIDPATIAEAIPPDLEYACVHWVHHLRRSGRFALPKGVIFDFLACYFLYWLEVLNLIGAADESLPLIHVLQSLFEGEERTRFGQFLDGATSFIRHSQGIAKRVPLQLYASGVLLVPEPSTIGSIFYHEKPGRVSVGPYPPPSRSLETQVLEGYAAGIYALSFSADKKLLAGVSDDGRITVWDIASGRAIQQMGNRTTEWEQTRVSRIALSPDGELLASATCSGIISLWKLRTGEMLREFAGHADKVSALAFFSEQLIASGSADRTIALWDPMTGKELRRLKSHTAAVTSLALSPRRNLLVSASNGGTVLLWDLANGGEPREVDGLNGNKNAIAFSADGEILATQLDDRSIKLRDVKTGSTLWAFIGYRDATTTAFSSDGKWLATPGSGTITLWSLQTGKEDIKSYGQAVTAVKISPDGKLALTVVGRRGIVIWGLRIEFQQLRLNFSTDILAAAFSPDSQLLAVALGERKVVLWNIITGGEQQSLDAHHRTKRRLMEGDIVFSPDGTVLALALPRSPILLWDVETGHALHKLGVGFTSNIAFSLDGAMLASTSVDNAGSIAGLWDLRTAGSERKLQGHHREVNCLAFSHNHKLASASQDWTVRIWDPATENQELELFHCGVRAVAFSPDGTLLASASNCTVKLWDLATGEARREFEIDGVKALAFSTQKPFLETNRGIFNIESYYVPAGFSARTSAITTEVTIRDEWIVRDSERLVWLPPEYRPRCSAVSGDRFVLGCASGMVVFVNFDLTSDGERNELV
ncbi:WD40-repeat-containing domain protein [Durotheca rogersii]|uniref:WD40-repeat-containing domain protein n=1 Tax=Durotheca rogersii TaxID=419775 RepID=UPI0022211B60|nr:WD40-repeat-containing domain protein [Durotheca rogersii]KAI5862276.1 WD40-repeat-containing domain protein [Durotheca rogersii]